MHLLCLPALEFQAVPAKSGEVTEQKTPLRKLPNNEFSSTRSRNMPSPILAPSPCPTAGAGVHSWILSMANRCRWAKLPETEAVRRITGGMTRQPSPANEVITAVQKAYRSTWQPPQSGKSFRPHPVSMAEIKFDPSKLKAMAEKIRAPKNWRHFFWERSPKLPDAMNAYSFISNLYEPGEQVLVFDVFETKNPVAVVRVTEPMDCRVPPMIEAGGRYGNGIWFLSNPTDGQWHPNPRQNNEVSCRSEESVTSFRYAVLESDQAPADVWIAFVAQLPARVSAIYTSGGRSIHTLLRVDAATKAEWDGSIAPLKRPLKKLGGDSGALSAVRLSRLPGCWRPEKQNFQKLLYLNPNPSLSPLIELPALRSRAEALHRWRRVCPRWNQSMEAHR